MDDLALIILNYNCSNLTITCVDQLISFNCTYKIVIVDNASTDESYNILKDYYKDTQVYVLQSHHNGGYSYGNNLGIKYAVDNFNINYIGILNPDVLIPDKTVILNLLERIKKWDTCAVVGATAIDINGHFDPKNSAWMIPNAYEFLKSKIAIFSKRPSAVSWKVVENAVVEVDCIAGSFFIADVTALRSIGFLDESLFMYNEELLLGYKLKHNGYKECLCLDLCYFHNHMAAKNVTPSEYIRKRKRRFASDVVLCRKIYSSRVLPILWAIETANRVLVFSWLCIKRMTGGE